ncbi:RAP1GDS1 [Branchiostoma lanceolatum]|uniref:RAP1GDS1 protein n=1 Tax=Branchiostoma lanceolatum TaxID=7740 RepID=A0A8K0EDN1_BRALA|nr:RAP1GDS1 [Branchiostoma lanceolatum]CAH1247013.1 RAP1GDS1 [Branchiostoma lanceolatum]
MDKLENALRQLELTNDNGLQGPQQAGSMETSTCVSCMLGALSENGIETGRIILSRGVLPKLCPLLGTGCKDVAEVAKLVAELAKNEFLRLPCVEAGLVQPLVGLLSCDEPAAVKQACRALGNICFDNDPARNVVKSLGGLEKLFAILQSLTSSQPQPDHSSMCAVGCGFLLNLTNTHESLQSEALSLGAVKVLVEILRQNMEDPSVCQMVLLCVGSMAESDAGKESLHGASFAPHVVKLMETEVGSDLMETILELLATLAEHDEIKLQIVQAGATASLLRLTCESEGANEGDGSSLPKVSADLIVQLLTGDESMKLLYASGDGPVLKEVMSAWLPSDREHLQVAGVLAVGNFARNEENCVQLVAMGIVEPLLTLLHKHDGKVGAMNIQHGVLSALRNLAIPVANKAVLLKAGVLKDLLSCLDVDISPVQFKLLGTLRMLVDGQESTALQVGKDTSVVRRLVELGGVVEHAGVMGDASRLLAAIIKHSRSEEVVSSVVNQGGVARLVAMATSEHPVMQNEALIALIISVTVSPESTVGSLESAEVTKAIHRLLDDQNCDPHVQCNVMTLVSSLLQSDVLYAEFASRGVLDQVKLLCSHENQLLSQNARMVQEKIQLHGT